MNHASRFTPAADAFLLDSLPSEVFEVSQVRQMPQRRLEADAQPVRHLPHRILRFQRPGQQPVVKAPRRTETGGAPG